MEIWAEVNEIENRNTEKHNKTKNKFFEKIIRSD